MEDILNTSAGTENSFKTLSCMVCGNAKAASNSGIENDSLLFMHLFTLENGPVIA